MSKVRSPAVAGSFYAADRRQLQLEVADLVAAAAHPATELTPRMVIAPHAGYVYSGSVAAAAYKTIADWESAPGRIALIGPSHFVGFAGIATPGVEGLGTPLGTVRVDQELTKRAEAHPAVAPSPAAHRREHSLEVQLPFLQTILEDFSVVALATGDVDDESAADVLGDLLAEPDTVGVVSSDLSHYLDYDSARARDQATAAAITRLDWEVIGPEDACGRTAIRAGLIVADRRGWSCRQLLLANSGDSAGPHNRVVGYGAFVLGPPA